MQHCTPEQLALAALREPLPEPDAAHLGSCAPCRAEVTSLQRSVDALAVPQLAAPSGTTAPPPSVWESIAAATGVRAVPRPAVVEAHAAADAAGPSPVTVVPAPAPPVAPPSGVVRQLRPRRSRLVLAAAASLLVGTAVGAGAVALGTREDGGEAVAATELESLDDRGAAGSAAVVTRGGGTVLEVVLDAPAAEDGYYEVWLLEPAVERMVQVGVVRAGTTTLDLPEGIDLAEYPIVDVSVEPLDGDPTHSGVSVARGVLDA